MSDFFENNTLPEIHTVAQRQRYEKQRRKWEETERERQRVAAANPFRPGGWVVPPKPPEPTPALAPAVSVDHLLAEARIVREYHEATGWAQQELMLQFAHSRGIVRHNGGFQNKAQIDETLAALNSMAPGK